MLIKVKVFPASKKEEIIRKSEDSFEVKVKAKPVRGTANREVVRLLSLYFKVSEQDIKLVKGFKQRNKIFEITKI